MNRNTILENAPKLPDGLRWILVSHSHPLFIFSMSSSYELSNFDNVIFRQQKNDILWLVELVRDNVIYFGFVKMVRK